MDIFFIHHRLVCEAFWGPPPAPDLQVDHKDGTKFNNHYQNLEWVTDPENKRRSYLTNKNRRSSAAKLSKPVYARKHKTHDERGRAKADSKQRAYLRRHPTKTKTNRRLGVQAETAKVKEKPVTSTVFRT